MKNNKEKTNIIRPITLDVDKDLWKKFKGKVSRAISLNDAIVNLIKKYVGKKKDL